jgi:hypothetical protein
MRDAWRGGGGTRTNMGGKVRVRAGLDRGRLFMIRRKEGGGVSDVRVGRIRYFGRRMVHSDGMLSLAM